MRSFRKALFPILTDIRSLRETAFREHRVFSLPPAAAPSQGFEVAPRLRWGLIDAFGKSLAKLSGVTPFGYFFTPCRRQRRRQFHRSGTFAAAASTTPASHRRYTDAMPCLQAVGWNLPCGICKGSVCRRGGVPPLHSYCALAGLYDHSSFTRPVS